MKREKELATVTLMIGLYCRKKHGTQKGTLCSECTALLEYVKLRRSKCPWGEEKPFCSNCRIHCYRPDMRAKIAEVMRYSGPKMVLYHPVIALRHLTESRRQKKRNKREEKDV